jgi:DNA-binding NarL/FixJ family response regulator
MKIKLCIAEDQELLARSLQVVLNMEPDFEVVGIADNGLKAIELCEHMAPDIVLMDIHMPVMDGIEATKQIKQRWPHIKVIALTTFQDAAYAANVLNSGAEGYILKAIDPEDLAAGIRLVSRGETLITQDVLRMLFNTETKKLWANNRFGLTERELEVLSCLSYGLSNREIAAKMLLSEGTVKNYISNIYTKLEVDNRALAVKKAVDEGLI